jgi:hypothetical protein
MTEAATKQEQKIRVFAKAEVGEVLQRIYDSEINVRIQSFWDGGFETAVGDEMNGWEDAPSIVQAACKALDYNERKIEVVVAALAFEVVQHYPDSTFAQWYREGIEDGGKVVND